MAATAVFRPEADPPARPQAAGRFFRPELDVLRFFAFSLVFLYHVVPPGMFHSRLLLSICESGAFGVPVFFALSAYLITELLTRELNATGTINLRSFYIRRILRIWPLYFLALALGFVLSRVLGPKPISLKAIAAYVFLSGNWYAVLHNALPNGSGVLWSIGVEEQFYLLWPTVTRLGRRTGAIAVCLVIWVLSQFAVVVLCRRGVPYYVIWFNTLAQMQYFAIGALISIFMRGRIPKFSGLARVALVLTGLAIFSIFSLTEDRSTYWPYFSAGIGATLLLVGFLGLSIPSWGASLRYLGKISYGLYIFHNVVIVVTVFAARNLLRMQHNIFLMRLTVGWMVTVLIAHLSYKYFETPFLKLKERFEVVKSRPA